MAEERDAAHCPFCGKDAVEGWDEWCAHLIADYGDGSDGDDGVLCGSGGSRSGNEALACLDTLRDALAEFTKLFVDPTELEDGEVEADRDAVVKAAFPEGSPPMWISAMLEYFSGGSAIHWVVRDILDGAVDWDESLVKTHSTIGTMASTWVTFVWARDAAQGGRRIEAAINPITSDVRATTGRLVSEGWKPRGNQ
jgi:hypothetical protein